MASCKAQRPHRRVNRGRGHASDHKRPLKGHVWIRTESGRKCELCGKKVKG